MNTEQFDFLPSDWMLCRFDEFILKVKRGPSKKCNTEGRGIRYITSGNLNNGILDLDLDYKFLDDLENIDKCRLIPDDLIINCVNSLERVGKSAIFNESHGEAIVGFNNYALELKEQVIIPKYANYFCQSQNFKTQIFFLVKRAVNQVSFATRELNKLEIPLPPLNEQRRIVAKIEELRAHTLRSQQALDEIPALIDQFRQSVLAAAFRGDLTADWRKKNPNVEPAEQLLERIKEERRQKWEEAELEKMWAKGKEPKNNTWKDKYQECCNLNTNNLPRLPKNWCWVNWKQIGIGQNGRAFPSKEYSTDGVKLLRPGNLHVTGDIEWTSSNTRYMPEEWAAKYPNYIVQENELVINLTAQSLADEFLGRVCLTRKNERCLLNQRIARLKPSILSPRFCLWLFKSPIFRKYVNTLNTGSMIQHMFTSQIDEFIFPMPPLKEQEKIIEAIEQQLATIEKVYSMVEGISKDLPIFNQSILAKAFRGELVPQDPNDEPASALLDRIRTEREKLSTTKTQKRSSRNSAQ